MTTPCFESPTGKCQRTAPCVEACGMRVMAQMPGEFKPYPPLDEERVRQIVRQEIAAALASHKPAELMTFGGKP